MKIAVVAPIMASREMGGAENFYQGLINALRTAGHQATLIEVKVNESSFDDILDAYCRCFYLNLDDYDLVISTKAPTYMIRHRNHVSYLLHTMRVFYDRFEPRTDVDYQRKRLIHKFDRYGLSPERIKKHCVIGEAVVQRLKDADAYWNDIEFHIIHPAPLQSIFKEPKDGEYVFLPGRLHPWKRVDLAIKAMAYVKPPIKLVISGSGEDESRLKDLTRRLHLENRVEFLGAVNQDDLLDRYSKAIAIPFLPLHEDFGYITVEAFKSKKPVITCIDSGEPSRIVQNGVNGYVVDPDPKMIGEKMDYLARHPDEARLMGERGSISVQDLTWERVVEKLLHAASASQNTRRKRRILVTDNQVLDPPVGGGRVRIFELYRHFDPSVNDITYLGTFDWLGPQEREQKLADHFTEVLVPMTVQQISLDGIFSRLAKATTLDVTTPILLKLTPKYSRKLKMLLPDQDVVVLSHPWVYPQVKEALKELNTKPILVYDSHNVEFNIKKGLLHNTMTGKLLSSQVRKIEGSLVNDCDLVFACSKDDAESFTKIYGIDTDKIKIIPNGSSVADIRPPTIDEKRSFKSKFGLSERLAVLFLASGGYKPNDDAARYICQTLAPRCIDFNFVLVGSICQVISKEFGAFAGENIRLMGVVDLEEKKQILCASDLALNPVTMGSGTNIKVFDYLAAGLPLITTPVGARGIDFTDGKDALIRDLSGFSEAAFSLANDAKLRASISNGARELAERYDWRHIALDAQKSIESFERSLR